MKRPKRSIQINFRMASSEQRAANSQEPGANSQQQKKDTVQRVPLLGTLAPSHRESTRTPTRRASWETQAGRAEARQRQRAKGKGRAKGQSMGGEGMAWRAWQHGSGRGLLCGRSLATVCTDGGWSTVRRALCLLWTLDLSLETTTGVPSPGEDGLGGWLLAGKGTIWIAGRLLGEYLPSLTQAFIDPVPDRGGADMILNRTYRYCTDTVQIQTQILYRTIEGATTYSSMEVQEPCPLLYGSVPARTFRSPVMLPSCCWLLLEDDYGDDYGEEGDENDA